MFFPIYESKLKLRCSPSTRVNKKIARLITMANKCRVSIWLLWIKFVNLDINLIDLKVEVIKSNRNEQENPTHFKDRYNLPPKKRGVGAIIPLALLLNCYTADN